jgi:type I restriction enzyme R subunit
MVFASEKDLEDACLGWFGSLGYEHLPSAHTAPGSVYDERASASDVFLLGRLREALRRLNPEASEEALAEGLRVLLRTEAPTLVLRNQAFHRLLVDGIEVDVARPASDGGGVMGVRLRVLDFDDPEENDYVVASQLEVATVRQASLPTRIPDLVVYVNGLPLAVLELKGPESTENVWDAIQQLHTYKAEVPQLFGPNVVLVAGDGVQARIGSLTADDSRYAKWRTIAGEGDEPNDADPLKVLVLGVFEKARFCDYVQNFVTFEAERDRVVKKIAGYHQFHAVRRAVLETERASAAGGDRRIGVIWHTQGSGKSLSMVFYARKLVLSRAMQNPTLVVLTDRNDLDDQLFGTFALSQALLRQPPKNAESREALRTMLKVASGGIFFTTIQKFLPAEGERHPTLSERRNIVVIADEAHRSQYGFKGKLDTKSGAFAYGFAKHMRDALPNASFIGFTGTPIELEDKSTTQVFGDTLSVYDMRRAVEDQAVVPITYENRLAKLDLPETEKPHVDEQFDELTEDEEDAKAEALKSEWATIEALVGTEKRVALVANDIVTHFERRSRDLEGKALVVCMSRRICAQLYEAIVALRPEWHDPEDDAGAIKVVMTGKASDEPRLQAHVRSKEGRRRLQERFKDPADPLKLVIVRDMWLTGFDVPCMHTLYVDKPMAGANLMQAIARVNRVFKDKPGGLVVDYIGLAAALRAATRTYTRAGGHGDTTEQQDAAVTVLRRELEVCRDALHGCDVSRIAEASREDRLKILAAAREHVLKKKLPKGEAAQRPPGDTPKKDGYDSFVAAVDKVTRAFALATPHEFCEEVREEVAFYQAVKVGLVKLERGKRPPSQDLGHAVRQIVEGAVVTADVLDVFDAAGLPKPDISILSPEFLSELKGMKNENLAAMLLERLLADEVRARGERSLVQQRKFSEMLEDAVRRYQNRTIEAAQVIAELIELAKKMREADAQGDALKLTKDEAAFYEALAENESAVKVLGDVQLCEIAREVTQVVRKNATIDWTRKESVQAKLRIEVKKVLKRTGYPPDGQQKATDDVLEQAKRLGIRLSSPEPANDDVPSIPPSSRARPFPYPIARFDALLTTQPEAILRVKTYRDAFEKALAFMAGCALSLVTAQNGGKMPDKALALLKKVLGKPISMGAWHELAWRLSAMVTPGSAALVRAVRALSTLEGKPSPLMNEVMTEVVEERNVFSHSVTPTSELVAEAEPGLTALWERFKKAISPLTETRLVVSVRFEDMDHPNRYHFSVRVLEGSSDMFPVRRMTLPQKLKDTFCYLLDGEEVFDLGPLVFAHHDAQMARHEVFVARKISGLEKGDRVEGSAVSGPSGAKVVVG